MTTYEQRLERIDRELEVLSTKLVTKRLERDEIFDAMIKEQVAKLEALQARAGRRVRTVLPINGTAPKASYSGRKRGVPKGTPNMLQRKLADDDVRQMRRLFAEGALSQRELGEQFGVPQPQVSKIVRRLTYADVV